MGEAINWEFKVDIYIHTYTHIYICIVYTHTYIYWINREFGIDTYAYKYISIFKIDNQQRPSAYSTGNYAQYSVIT